MTNKELFKKDLYRNISEENIHFNGFVKHFIKHHEIRFLFFYRNKNIISKVILFFIKRKYGLEIASKNIGEGLYLGHAYGITINPNAVIGNNCNIHKGVTIGQENRGKRKGAPTIGNQVWIGVNSTIVGNIKIGDDVLIAPNTYINQDIPSHSIVLGNPCIIKHNKDLKERVTKFYIENIV